MEGREGGLRWCSAGPGVVAVEGSAVDDEAQSSSQLSSLSSEAALNFAFRLSAS